MQSRRPPRVFLCRADVDADAVDNLYKHLIQDGVEVWINNKSLLPGQDRDLENLRAIRIADAVVICLSENFNKAGRQQKEMRIALNEAETQPEGEIFIIPARLENCEIPEGMKQLQWVDLFKPDGYSKLLQSIYLRMDDGKTQEIARRRSVLPVKLTVMKPKARSAKPKVLQRTKKRRVKVQSKSLVGKSSETTILKKKGKKHKNLKPEIIVAIIAAFATIVTGVLSSPILLKYVDEKAQNSPPTVTSETNCHVSCPTEIFDVDLAGNSILMRLVPAGPFFMGSDYGVNDGNLVHEVDLDSFYIDAYEITNSLYKDCVSAGACKPPIISSSYARKTYYEDVRFNSYPVINVTWFMAETYCEWRGANLPTEAQWEKAARGGLAGQSYPWGNVEPLCKYDAINGARFDDHANCDAADTDMVGNYFPNGFGIFDMAGNVWEWTSSLYKPYPYSSGDGRENLNTKGARVLRGGSWFNVEYLLRVSFRNKGYPDLSSYYIGFRCARTNP